MLVEIPPNIVVKDRKYGLFIAGCANECKLELYL